MAVTSTPVFVQTPKCYAQQFTIADTTTKKTLVTAGTNGTKIDSITVQSNDTTARDFQLFVNDGTTDYWLATVSIPVNSGGTNAIPTVDYLNHGQCCNFPLDSAGNRTILLMAGWSLKFAAGATLTTAKAINIFATGGDY